MTISVAGPGPLIHPSDTRPAPPSPVRPTGVYKTDGPFDSYISVLKVPELHAVTKTADTASFGGAVTLTRLVEELRSLSASAGFRHCQQVAAHLLVVANTPVRNMASWAGNLMIKHAHREFPSDVFLLLTAARARLVIGECVCSPRCD